MLKINAMSVYQRDYRPTVALQVDVIMGIRSFCYFEKQRPKLFGTRQQRCEHVICILVNGKPYGVDDGAVG